MNIGEFYKAALKIYSHRDTMVLEKQNLFNNFTSSKQFFVKAV